MQNIKLRCCFLVKVPILGRFDCKKNRKLVSYGLRMLEGSTGFLDSMIL
ncbi:hypothetical protein R6Q59_027630 [Mikania micrantha]